MVFALVVLGLLWLVSVVFLLVRLGQHEVRLLVLAERVDTLTEQAEENDLEVGVLGAHVDMIGRVLAAEERPAK